MHPLNVYHEGALNIIVLGVNHSRVIKHIQIIFQVYSFNCIICIYVCHIYITFPGDSSPLVFVKSNITGVRNIQKYENSLLPRILRDLQIKCLQYIQYCIYRKAFDAKSGITTALYMEARMKLFLGCNAFRGGNVYSKRTFPVYNISGSILKTQKM